MAGDDDETPPRFGRYLTDREIAMRLKRHSDNDQLLMRGQAELREEMVEIVGRDGEGGRLGQLEEKVEKVEAAVVLGFDKVGESLKAQNAGGKKLALTVLALVIIPLIGAAVLLYQRIAVLETLMKWKAGT